MLATCVPPPHVLAGFALQRISEDGMKTYSARPADMERRWLVVDAEGKTLGRLASQVAMVLRGKHKPMYRPLMDTGDHVVIVNAGKVALSGKKAQDKKYFHHPLYP